MAMTTLPPFPTYAELEEYVYSLEQYVPLPSDIAQVVQQLYRDLMRFGPPAFPEIPSFERFVEVPAPPPPPPPKGLVDKISDWVSENKWALCLATLGVLGALGYGAYHVHITSGHLTNLRKRRLREGRAGSKTINERPEIVVILGADSASYGPAIVRQFQRDGYVVIASVLSGDIADELERDGQGYVRALVLDAEEPGSVPHFLRSLSSTLSLRFPTTAHGDPYLSMTSSHSGTTSSNVSNVAAIISLLSLAPAELMPFNALRSPLILAENFTHHLTSRAFTPLSIIHMVLPVFQLRQSSWRAPNETAPPKGASIILCVPAVARVGAVGSSAISMATGAVVRGFDVLRREVAVDPTVRRGNLSFVTLDVGEIGESRVGSLRKPSDVSVLYSTLLGIVRGRRRPWSLDWLYSMWLGNRRIVGAGAFTYVTASRLPNFLLDFLLGLPYHLENMRSSLYPTATPQPTPQSTEPSVVEPTPRTQVSTSIPPVSNGEGALVEVVTEQHPEYPSESESNGSSKASLAVSSQAGGTIADSWISLQGQSENEL